MNRTVPELPESVAPPRDNGELQFEAPWQGRVFSLALALHADGVFPWSEFSTRLGVALAASPQPAAASVLPVPAHTTDAYYRAWIAALEGLLQERRLLTVAEVEQREHALQLMDDHRH